MDNTTWTQVDHFFTDTLIGPDPVFAEILKHNAQSGLPAIDVSAPLGQLLNLLIRLNGSKRVLEIGTLGGYSTVWMAKALPADGQLISLEVEPKHADVARANIAKAKCDQIAQVRVGKALELLPQIAEESREPFDFAFIDADKANNPNYFNWALKMARKGTCIVVDNVVRRGAVADPSNQDPGVQGVRQLAAMIKDNPKVDATALQIVGTKGWDGFVLATVL